MSGVEWTDAERGCCFGTCGGDIRQHAPHEDQGCAMFEDMLRYLAPFVADRERAPAARALREAADRFPVANHRLIGGKDARNWLRDRADRIERGES